MPLGWSIPVPTLNRIRLTVPQLGRLQFYIDRQLKVPIFTFFGGKGSQQRRRAIEALEAYSLKNRVKSITLCVTLNANNGKIVLVTLCIQIEWLFYNAFWCETVT